jgi:hypothetical protein
MKAVAECIVNAALYLLAFVIVPWAFVALAVVATLKVIK